MKRIVIVVVCLIIFTGLLVYTMLDQEKIPQTKQTETPEVSPLPMKISTEIKTGETVAFGHYEQDDDSTTADPLFWYVIEVKDGKALVLSTNVIEVMIFSSYSAHLNDSKQSRWKYSTPREWLNREFYNMAFSDDEKKRIMLTTLETDSFDADKNTIVDITEDYVFLLNAEEVETLNGDTRRAQPTQHTINQDIYVSGGSRYWTRSMADNGYVGYYTNGDNVSYYVPKYERTGVRPAMWISIP